MCEVVFAERAPRSHRCLERDLVAFSSCVAPRPIALPGPRAEASGGQKLQPAGGVLAAYSSCGVERLFRFVGLMCPGEDVRILYRGWRDASPTARDSSRELLQHLLQPPLRDPVQALVDDVDDAGKLARAGGYHERLRTDYETLMKALLEKGGVGMRCLVAYHVGEMRMRGLQSTLRALPSDLAGLVARSVDRATQLLADPDEKKVADGT